MPNGSTFSCKPREHNTANGNCPHARIGGCNVLLAGPASFDIFAIVLGALDKQNDRLQKQENWPKIPVATSKVNPEQPSAPILGSLLVATCGRPNREMQMMSHFVIENPVPNLAADGDNLIINQGDAHCALSKPISDSMNPRPCSVSRWGRGSRFGNCDMISTQNVWTGGSGC